MFLNKFTKYFSTLVDDHLERILVAKHLDLSNKKVK